MSESGNEFLIPGVAADHAAQQQLAEDRQRAALKPFDGPHDPRRGKGRKNAGLSVLEWMNKLLAIGEDGEPRYTKDDLKAIADNPASAPLCIIAARQVLLMMSDPTKYVVDKKGRARRAGSDPEVGRALDRLLDRTIGKPVVNVNVREPDALAIEEKRAQLAAILMGSPLMLRLLESRLATLPAAAPTVGDESSGRTVLPVINEA